MLIVYTSCNKYIITSINLKYSRKKKKLFNRFKENQLAKILN